MQLSAGSAQPVAVSLPEPVADLPLADEEIRARATRFLPLSGKADGALRELAGRYLSWLDACTMGKGTQRRCLRTWRGRQA